MYLIFKLTNGSCWLTSHRLIMCKHAPEHYEEGTPESYLIRNLKKTEINKQTLTAHFEGRPKVQINLQTHTPSILKEIKAYLEDATKIWIKSDVMDNY